MSARRGASLRKRYDRCWHIPGPGNVRELENVIERAVVLSAGVKLVLNFFPTRLQAGRRIFSTGTPH
jgi:DNA-binding NtrC family response regulator